MSTNMRTRDQERAKLAWEMVARAEYPDDFAKACKKMASRILTSGLGPALAFCLTKTEAEQKLLAQSIARRLGSNDDGHDYLRQLIESDADRLRRDTDEAMAFLAWLARLADGKAKKAKQGGA